MNDFIRYVLHLPRQASTFAAGLDQLHFTILALTILGVFGITLATLGFLVRHESSQKPRNTPRGASKVFEVTMISGMLAMFVAFWIVGYQQYIHIATPPSNTFDVYVIGKKWMWAFAYADGGASNYDLYVPVGKPVRLFLTSRDVIHSFFVPAMRTKQDAVPGRMTVSWFEVKEPGTYQILCAEYCGLSHSRMRGRVIALPPQEYERFRSQHWDVAERGVSDQRPLTHNAESRVSESLITQGRRIAAERGCLRCHTLDGTPHLGPSWAGLYQSTVPLEDGSQVVADAGYLTRSMMDPTADVHEGFAPIMPSYMGLLDAPEVASIVELIRSLRDVNVVQGRAPLPVPTEASPTLEVDRDVHTLAVGDAGATRALGREERVREVPAEESYAEGRRSDAGMERDAGKQRDSLGEAGAE